MPHPHTWTADGTVCEGCGRELVPGDLICFAVDAPDSGPATSSNPPTCAECVTTGEDSYGLTWVQSIRMLANAGESIEWVKVVENPDPNPDPDGAAVALMGLMRDVRDAVAAETTISWDDERGWKVTFYNSGEFNGFAQTGTGPTLALAIAAMKETE
jgi:hypothetical protein